MSFQADPLLAHDPVLAEAPMVNRQLVMGHVMAGIGFLVYSLLMGFLYLLQLTGNYPFPEINLLSAGKIGLIHTNVLVFGFVFNMLFAGMYWAVPAMMKKRVAGPTLGYALLGLWNIAILLTIAGIHAGAAQALPWGETPNGIVDLVLGDPHFFFVDELLAVGMLLAIIQFSVPLAAYGMREAIPVGGWFIAGGLVWFLLAHLIGSYGFELATGASGAVFAGLYAAGVIGLSITALGWGLMYYFVPAVIKKPIWNHAIAIIGFWGLAFFYPLSGASNFLNTAVPAFAQNGAVVFTVAVQLVVLTLSLGFFMSLRGTNAFTYLATRYFYTGIAFFIVSSVLTILEVQFDVQRLIQFSEWTVGHSFLVLYGVFGFWALGIVYDLWPRLVGKTGWYSHELNEWIYWLNLVGVLVYFLSGLIAGAVQGGLWRAGAGWVDVQQSIDGFWQLQGIMLVVLIWANSLLILNMIMTTMPASTSLSSTE